MILFTDDQGTLDAGCYGSDHLITPHIDRLAAEGTRFTQAYAHTACCPARAALLTGRHPQRGGIDNWPQGDMNAPEKGINLALDEVTLAEVLRGAGYRSTLFGKWHLGARRDHGPTRQGFDEFFGIRGGFIDNYNHHFLHGTGFHDLYEGTEPVIAEGEYFPDMLVRRSLEFIEKTRSARSSSTPRSTCRITPSRPPNDSPGSTPTPRMKNSAPTARSSAPSTTTSASSSTSSTASASPTTPSSSS